MTLRLLDRVITPAAVDRNGCLGRTVCPPRPPGARGEIEYNCPVPQHERCFCARDFHISTDRRMPERNRTRKGAARGCGSYHCSGARGPGHNRWTSFVTLRSWHGARSGKAWGAAIWSNPSKIGCVQFTLSAPCKFKDTLVLWPYSPHSARDGSTMETRQMRRRQFHGSGPGASSCAGHREMWEDRTGQMPWPGGGGSRWGPV